MIATLFPTHYFDIANANLVEVRHLANKVRDATACPGENLSPKQTDDLLQDVLIAINKLQGLAEEIENNIDYLDREFTADLD